MPRSPLWLPPKPAPSTRGDDWHNRAACIGHERTFDDADLELHTTSRKPTFDVTNDALRIEKGTRSSERFSIRGGLTPTERANTKKATA